MPKTIMEKADEILARCGLSPTSETSSPNSPAGERTVGLNRAEEKMEPVTQDQAAMFLNAAGVLTEEIGEEGRTSGRTKKRRRKAVPRNEEPEKMEKSSAEEEEDRAKESEESEEPQVQQDESVSGKWKPISSRVENLGTTVGHIGVNFADSKTEEKPVKRGRKRKVVRSIKESMSFDNFINKVFKNV
jgi:hypothetical protein